MKSESEQLAAVKRQMDALSAVAGDAVFCQRARDFESDLVGLADILGKLRRGHEEHWAKTASPDTLSVGHASLMVSILEALKHQLDDLLATPTCAEYFDATKACHEAFRK